MTATGLVSRSHNGIQKGLMNEIANRFSSSKSTPVGLIVGRPSTLSFGGSVESPNQPISDRMAGS